MIGEDYDPLSKVEQNYHSIKVSFTTLSRITEDLESMDPSKRDCFYPEEKELSMFPAYSRANCELGCAWERAKRVCGCVPWFLMGRRQEWGSLCDSIGNSCFKTIVDNRHRDSDDEEEEDRSGDQCEKGCLPDCTITEFKLESGLQEKWLLEHWRK